MIRLILVTILTPLLALAQTNMSPNASPRGGRVKRNSLLINTSQNPNKAREILNLYQNSVVRGGAINAIRNGLGTESLSADGRTAAEEPAQQLLRSLSIFDTWFACGVLKQQEILQDGKPYHLEVLATPINQSVFSQQAPLPKDFLRLPELSSPAHLSLDKLNAGDVVQSLISTASAVVAQSTRELPSPGTLERASVVSSVRSGIAQTLVSQYPYSLIPSDPNPVVPTNTDAGYLYSLLNNYLPVMIYNSLVIQPEEATKGKNGKSSEFRQTIILPAVGELVTKDDKGQKLDPSSWHIRPIDRPLEGDQIIKAPGMVFDHIKFGKFQTDRTRPAAVRLDLVKDFNKPDELQLEVHFGYLDISRQSVVVPRGSLAIPGSLDFAPVSTASGMFNTGYKENALSMSGHMSYDSEPIEFYFHQLAFKLTRPPSVSKSCDQASTDDLPFTQMEVIPEKTLLRFHLNGRLYADNQTIYPITHVFGMIAASQANPSINQKVDLKTSSGSFNKLVLNLLGQINQTQELLGETVKSFGQDLLKLNK